MTTRYRVMMASGAGFLWAALLLWVAARHVTLPVFTLMPTIMMAFMAPGLVLAAMVLRVAMRRLGDEAMLAGGALQGPASVDQRVLQNTLEQLVIALCVWPAAAIMLGDAGPGVIVVLGFGFALMRLVFWLGYHRAPLLRVFGFAGSFWPTILVALWALLRLGMASTG
ncbi:MAG: MAPEG family protein [Pseudomonadota bacterium]|uniref:MAPEG family protein n=1 Tax=Roseovarius TaxID=74030 RepID=UPI0022A883EF|nr:MAPEG family protein [Roseovarius sp. EGI FJ00037]MCZ0812086.1 MAPEG family protein [Roseovarius sp. EGI FJ00037]